MLAPDYLDHAPDRLVLLWQQVEDDILRDVARRIRKMETLTPTANWQLWRYQQVEAVRQDVVKLHLRHPLLWRPGFYPVRGRKDPLSGPDRAVPPL